MKLLKFKIIGLLILFTFSLCQKENSVSKDTDIFTIQSNEIAYARIKFSDSLYVYKNNIKLDTVSMELINPLPGMSLKGNVFNWLPSNKDIGERAIMVYCKYKDILNDTLYWDITIDSSHINVINLQSQAYVGVEYIDSIEVFHLNKKIKTISVKFKENENEISFEDAKIIWKPNMNDTGTHEKLIFIECDNGYHDTIIWNISVDTYDLKLNMTQSEFYVGVPFYDSLNIFLMNEKLDIITAKILTPVSSIYLNKDSIKWTPNLKDIGSNSIHIHVECENGFKDTVIWNTEVLPFYTNLKSGTEWKYNYYYCKDPFNKSYSRWIDGTIKFKVIEINIDDVISIACERIDSLLISTRKSRIDTTILLKDTNDSLTYDTTYTLFDTTRIETCEVYQAFNGSFFKENIVHHLFGTSFTYYKCYRCQWGYGSNPKFENKPTTGLNYSIEMLINSTKSKIVKFVNNSNTSYDHNYQSLYRSSHHGMLYYNKKHVNEFGVTDLEEHWTLDNFNSKKINTKYIMATIDSVLLDY